MSDFNPYVITNFLSYAVLALVFSVVKLIFPGIPFGGGTLILLFIMTTCIAFAMYFTDKVGFKNRALAVLIDVLEIVAIVFGIGFLSGFMPFEPLTFIVVGGMIPVVYFTVTAMMMIKNNADAEKINKRLIDIKSKKTNLIVEQGNEQVGRYTK